MHEVWCLPARDHRTADKRAGSRNPGPTSARRSYPDEAGIWHRHHLSDQPAGAAQCLLLEARQWTAFYRQNVCQREWEHLVRTYGTRMGGHEVQILRCAPTDL